MASYLDYEYQKYLDAQALKDKPWSYSLLAGGMDPKAIEADYRSRPSHILNGIQFGSGFASDDSRKFGNTADALWALGIDPNASRDALNWRISEILNPQSAWASRSNMGIDFTTPDFADFRKKFGADPSKWSDATLNEFLGAMGSAGLETNKAIKETKAASQGFGAILGKMLLAASPGLFGASIAGFPGIAGISGNPLSGLSDAFNGLLGGGPNPNAVPGLSTGVTTPTGGGLIGTGTLNTAPIGIMGGAPLSASPLATAGMQGSSLWDRLVDRVTDNVTDPQNIAQRIGTNLISSAVTPAATPAGGDAAQMMAGQGFNPRDWPTDIYPGEIQKVPGYLPGLLMAMQTRRGLLGG